MQDRYVKRIERHFNFNRTTLDNDIALLKLRSEFIFGTYVQPVCLPAQGEPLFSKTKVTIMGWGESMRRNPNSQRL